MRNTSRPLLASIVLIALFAAPSRGSSTIEAVRFSEDNERIRIVFDLAGDARPLWRGEGGRLRIDFPDTVIRRGIKISQFKKNPVLEKITLSGNYESSQADIYLSFPSYVKIYPLFYPARLVVDLWKNLKEFERRSVSPGMEYIRIAKTTESGPALGSILRVNPKFFSVTPALATGREYEPSFLESVMLFFRPVFPWVEERITHYHKQTVLDIAGREGALAAVNGTYFDKDGRPLGILMINGELITAPIYDRTALIISDDGKPFIDNVLVRTYLLAQGNFKIYVTAINEPADESDIALYTPKYGKKTGTKGFREVVVKGGEISEMSGGNSEIPREGYVISAGKRFEKLFLENLREGERVELKIDLMPYSINGAENFMQIVGGGPRLIKAGRIYVSKKEEKFKRDIAATRAARTAVGLTADGHLLFVTIDKTTRVRGGGGLTQSNGMSLEELSELLLGLGAVDAVNLDGGGSATMVVSGEVVNVPAAGYAIPISNAILLKPKI